MSPKEAAALLTMASAFDSRKVTRETAEAWASTLRDVRLEDARDALSRHFRESGDWLMPKHITAHVKRIRRERLEAYGTLPDPPPTVDADDTTAVIAWQRDTTRRIADGEDVPRPALTGRALSEDDARDLMPRVPADNDPSPMRQAYADAKAARERGVPVVDREEATS